MSAEKGQKMTLKMSTEGNKIPLNFIMRVIDHQWANVYRCLPLQPMDQRNYDGTRGQIKFLRF